MCTYGASIRFFSSATYLGIWGKALTFKAIDRLLASLKTRPRDKCTLYFAEVGCLTDLSDLINIHDAQHQPQQQSSRGIAPQWQVQPANEVIFSNSTGARLECSASGHPPPLVEWFQEDELISQNLHGIRVVMPNGSLVFPAFK